MRRRFVLYIIMISCIVSLSACTVPRVDGTRSKLEDKIYSSNEEGYRLITEGKLEEAIIILGTAIENVYELEPELKNLDRVVKRSELIDAPFNNISWAYHELGEYETSLQYIEKSLLILPNSSQEYSNEGNALYGLNRYKEAMDAYNQALSVDKENIYAYYGKGMLYYDEQNYQEALKQFDAYLKREPSDAETAEMKVYTLLNLNKDQDALKYTEDYFRHFSNTYDGFRVRGAALEATAQFDEIEQFYKKASEKFPDQWEAQIKLGEIYYNYEEYDEAIAFFQQLKDRFPDQPGINNWLIRIYSDLGEMDKVEQIYELAEGTLDIELAMGNAYMNQGLYIAAIPYFEHAIELAPKDQEGYLSKIKALYWGKRYYRCVQFGQRADKFTFERNSDIPWFIGDCQYQLGNYKEAVAYLQQATKRNPDDPESWSYLARSYLALEDDVKAEEANKRALELNPEDWMALEVQASLAERKKPIGERIESFFQDNYLYQKAADGLEHKLPRLGEPGLTNEEIAQVIDTAKAPGDPFTFTVYGDEYDQLKAAMDSDILYEVRGNVHYFKIEDFSTTTDDQFIQYIDRISNPESKTIVLDLRGNGGGLTESANNMLDALLPELVTCTLIDKDGYTYNYYSDAEQISFRKIYIFVDENTASAAEMLTLGLKTYLDNVVIVGRDTFGKGVGQRVFEDAKQRIMVYVVSHYWNVMQNNVSNLRITPDIKIKGNSLESYMKQVR